MPGLSRSDSTVTSSPEENLSIFSGRRGWQVGLLVPAFVFALFLFWIGSAWYAVVDQGKMSLAIDFKVFWAAGHLAHLGDPLAAFDINRLAEIHEASMEDEWMIWSYPPAFLVALKPLGALSFSQAWAIFSAISIVAMFLAVRPFACGITPVWFAFALPPAILPNLYMGQTTALWTAGLLAALAALQNGRLVLAGFFIGLLTLKPQLGLLIPLALVASGAWKTIISATITTIVISLMATLVVGVGYWAEMRDMMELHFETIRYSIQSMTLMLSPYSLLASIGLPDSVALALQWTLTALAGVAVFVAWRNPKVGFDLRAAVLILGISLSAPYFWFYEAGLVAMAALFLLRAGVLTTTPLRLVLAAAMWIGIGPATHFVLFKMTETLSLRLVFAPILILACAVCLQALIVTLRKPATPYVNDEVFQ
ncbi:MAG: glycosyltransferase family 87 protein [Ruegeria sp.]